MDVKPFIQYIKDMQKDFGGELQYGGQFYVLCELFNVDPEEVKKEIENDK